MVLCIALWSNALLKGKKCQVHPNFDGTWHLNYTLSR